MIKIKISFRFLKRRNALNLKEVFFLYKKTKTRSEREVASTLSCSRNTVAGIIARCEKYGKAWDDIKYLSDD